MYVCTAVLFNDIIYRWIPVPGNVAMCTTVLFIGKTNPHTVHIYNVCTVCMYCMYVLYVCTVCTTWEVARILYYYG